MEIVLSRDGGVPFKDQVARQIELKILAGAYASGARLPSVRMLARRLQVHPNTVSEAYQQLESAGHVLLHRGAGVFVRGRGPSSLQEARDLDEMIRVALDTALGKGFAPLEIRSAVERWLDASRPERIFVVDPAAAMAELIVHELREHVDVDVSSCAVGDLARDRGRAAGALLVCLPYHVERLRAIVPGGLVEAVTVHVAEEDQQEIRELRPGSIVLVVSHAETLLPFADVLLKSLRGAEILVETAALKMRGRWQRVAPAADVVFADRLAAPALRSLRLKRLKEFRVVDDQAAARIRKALGTIVLKHPAP